MNPSMWMPPVTMTGIRARPAVRARIPKFKKLLKSDQQMTRSPTIPPTAGKNKGYISYILLSTHFSAQESWNTWKMRF